MYQWLQRLFSRAPSAAHSAAPATAAADALPAAGMPDPAAHPVMPRPVLVVGSGSARQRPVPFDQLDRVNSAYDAWLFGRPDESSLDLAPRETEVLDALSAILASQQSGVTLVRRMPGLIPQLLQSLRSDNFSGAALARTISSDVVLVAAVIRLANGSFQGTGTSIASVEHAVILIGQEGLRQLIISVAFRPIIDMHSGYYTRTLAPRLWQHAERCAVANRMLAEELGIEPFEAFLAGLVHNVGLIVALRIMDQVAKDDQSLGSELFCAELTRLARRLTYSIGREWNFAECVTRAIEEQGAMQKGVPMSPLGRLLNLSDYLDKVRTLVHEGVLAEGQASVSAGLPTYAGRCYAALQVPGLGDDGAQ